MQILHCVACSVGGVKSPTYVAYEIPQGADLWQLIHDAALDYCLAEQKQGRKPEGLSYADFVTKVPNELCTKHGFEKKLLQDTAEALDGNILCLNRYDLKRQLDDLEAKQKWLADLHKEFGVFGRRLEPALRRSTAMADWTFFQITKQMLVWAEEFADSGYTSANCERNFATTKLALMKRSDKMEPPEAVQ